MILCITPNPAIDYTLSLDRLDAGAVNRAASGFAAAGGKGLNVARALTTLGGEATGAGFLGGLSGHYLTALAEREGIPGRWTWIEGETRTCMIIATDDGQDATVINGQGAPVTADDWARLHRDALAAASSAEAVCISGSLPPGSPLDAYADLVTTLQATGKPIWIDSSGDPLKRALAIPGLSIKVNGDEASAWMDQPVTTLDEAERAAVAAIVQFRLAAVVITLGKAGALYAEANGTQRYRAQPPPIRAVSSVGSGDSFLAALVLSLAQNQPPREALRRAIAAGTANALTLGGARFSMDDYRTILEGIN